MTIPRSHRPLLRSLLLLAALGLAGGASQAAQRTRGARDTTPRAAGETREPVEQETSTRAPSQAEIARSRDFEGAWEGAYLQGAKPAGLRLDLRLDPAQQETPRQAWAREHLRRRRAQLEGSSSAASEPGAPIRPGS